MIGALFCLLGVIGLLAGPAVAEARSGANCDLAGGHLRTVIDVIDGDTLTIVGGQQVKLVGALAPRAFDAAGAVTEWPLAKRAKTALAALVKGRDVRLVQLGRATDRYRRLLAQVLVDVDGAGLGWVQGQMIQRGWARAYALEGNAQCFSRLLRREGQARAAGLGIWGQAAYAVRNASHVHLLRRLSGTFQLVTGTVRTASVVGSRAYLNFGPDWRRDFTIRVDRRGLRRARRAGIDLGSLKGRVVRVRGWLTNRGGPLIAVSHLQVIELATPRADPAVSGQAADLATSAPLH